MNQIRVLRQLLAESMYVVDEALVADAILSRARAKRTVAEVMFRNDPRARSVKSFRLEHEARSFRLSRTPRRQLQH